MRLHILEERGRRAGIPPAVGLEMVEQQFQPILDSFGRGEMTDTWRTRTGFFCGRERECPFLLSPRMYCRRSPLFVFSEMPHEHCAEQFPFLTY